MKQQVTFRPKTVISEDLSTNLSEADFEMELLELVKKYIGQQLPLGDFEKEAQMLIARIPLLFNEFKDEELGWAKYWVEEMDYYGVEEVFYKRFNFPKFLKERSRNLNNK